MTNSSLDALFNAYLKSDSVIRTGENSYQNQETQFKSTFTKEALRSWWKHEYYPDDVDLFTAPEKLPSEVLSLFEPFIDRASYALCNKIHKKAKKLGYTFEWGLDAEPYNLRKICK